MSINSTKKIGQLHNYSRLSPTQVLFKINKSLSLFNNNIPLCNKPSHIDYKSKSLKPIFYHATSLDEHISRGSWILGYWCTNCFIECEHLPGQKRYCSKCMKLQNQKYKALQTRGLNKNIEPGVVKIFFNPCQLLQHVQIHCIEEISVNQLMLLPFPTGIGAEYFPHLKMISEALMDFMFLKNIHIVDWLWRNKIHKWWRMAKGDNPVANIIKKYPFEVQQIKQLLNSNNKVNLDSRLDYVCLKKRKIQNRKYYFKKSDSFVSNGQADNAKSIPLINTDVTKSTESFQLSSLKICQQRTDEQSDQRCCLNNSGQNLNVSAADETLQNINSNSKALKNKISVKNFAKITDSSLVENSKAASLHKAKNSNKHIPKIISNIPSRSSKFTAFIKSSDMSQKRRDKKIVFVRKNDKINMDPFYSRTKQNENSPKMNILKLKKVQIFKNNKTGRFQDLNRCNISVSCSQEKQNETGDRYPSLINEREHSSSTHKTVMKFYTGADSKHLENSNTVSENDFSVLSNESILNIPNTNRNVITGNKAEKNNLATERTLDLWSYTSTKTILEQLFGKEDLDFLTVAKNEEGKSFLLIEKNVALENNAEYRKRMLDSASKMNKNKIHLKIGHIKTLSRRYSEKFNVLNDEMIEGHTNLVFILENIAKNLDLPMQSTDDYFGLSCSTRSGNTCSTCQQVIRSPTYLIGFSEPVTESNNCLCFDFICFKCNTFQGNKERFDSHLKYHESKCPHTCPECRLDFPSSQSLEVHMWTQCFHQFAKRFLSCTICEIGGFCSMEAVINHYIVMHSIKMAACSLCCMVFEHKRYCLSHIKKGHPDIQNVTEPLHLILCQLDDRIMSIEAYQKHVLNHKCIQEVTFYSCDLCLDKSKKFETLESIKIHTYKCHLTELSKLISENALHEILLMENIQSIYEKQKQYNSGFEAATSHDITVVPTSDYHNNEKCNRLKSDENRQLELTSDSSVLMPQSNDESIKQTSFIDPSNLIRNSTPTELRNSNQLAEKEIVAQTQSDNTSNVSSTEETRNLTEKQTGILSELVGMNFEDISNNVYLQFEKSQEKLNNKSYQAQDQYNDPKSDFKYTANIRLSFQNEEMMEMNMLGNTTSYDTLAESNEAEEYLENITTGKINPVIRDTNEKFSATCTNPYLSTTGTTEYNLNENIKFDEKRKYKLIKTNDLNTDYRLDSLPNKISELTCQSLCEKRPIKSTEKEIVNKSDLNCNNRVAKLTSSEIVSTKVVKISNPMKESNDCSGVKAEPEKRNNKIDVIGNTSNDKEIQESLYSNNRQYPCSNINTMISSSENIKHTADRMKSNSYEEKQNERVAELSRQIVFDNISTGGSNVLEKNISKFDEDSSLKLLKSQNILSVGNLLPQSLLLTNTTDNMIPDYHSKTDSCFENSKTYEMKFLSDVRQSVNNKERTPESHSKDEADRTSHSLKNNVDKSLYDPKIAHDNDHRKIEMTDYNHVKIGPMLKEKIILNSENELDCSYQKKIDNDSGVESEIGQKEFSTKYKNTNKLASNVKSLKLIALQDFSNTWEDENFKCIANRKSNEAELQNKIDMEHNKHSKDSIESTNITAPDNNRKIDKNSPSITKQNVGVSKEFTVHNVKLNVDSVSSLIQQRNMKKVDKSEDRIKLLKPTSLTSESEEKNYPPSAELKNLSLTDDEKINLSKTSSLRVNNLKLSDSEKPVTNEKKLRPRILSRMNNKIMLKKKQKGDIVFHKNNKNLKRQRSVTKHNNTKKEISTEKKQNISKFKSKAALRQGDELLGKKVIINPFKKTEILPVKRNLKKCLPYIFKNDDTEIRNEKTKRELLQPQLSITRGEKKKSSCSKVINKNRIGFFSNESDIAKPCEFKCHLCGDLINTTWQNLSNHYSTKHAENYEVCNVSLKISRISQIDYDGKSCIKISNKRKSTEMLNTSLKKRKRRSTKKLSEKCNDTIVRTSGLYVQLEPIIDDEGNFKCKKCEERCINMTDLRKHIHNNHRISKKNLICLECGENFVVSPSLQMHLKAFHEIDDPISYMNKYPDYASVIADFETEIEVTVANQCHVCMAVFENNLAVDKHLRVHGMAFLNKKRIEARKAKLTTRTKQDEFNELDTESQLTENEHNKKEFFLNSRSTDLVS